MVNNLASTVLIFGYGSVGKKYAKYFLKKNYNVLIFDPYKKINNTKIKIFKSYKKLNKYKDKIQYSVICSLAGDHYNNFFIASNLGIKNILMEKPLTNNFNELYKIKKIKKKKK